MSRTKTPTIGQEQETLLTAAIKILTHTPLAGARNLPVLIGLHAPPQPIYTLPQDNVLLTAIDYMVKSGRIYAYENDLVLETDALNGQGQMLRRLRTAGTVASGAECLLANVFTCQDGPAMFSPPRWFVNLLLVCALHVTRLPRIRYYANRPAFDTNFHLCTQGWHGDTGVLIHGPHVEPVIHDTVDLNLPALERLPFHLKNLLGGFCFRSDADIANIIGMMLTGLLANHFVEALKGVFLIDGNQPGLGKTLLVRTVGVVLDGLDPRLIHYSAEDEEIQKRICAVLRGSWQSIVLIDNAKTVFGGAPVSSPAIEANSMAPMVSLRILGKSENFTRSNDLLWALTMNGTKVSPDLVSRGVPIQLEYEGQVEQRSFSGSDPIRYGRDHRLDILGELAGMVVKWTQAGLPNGQRSHRCHEWAHIVGGILEVAGYPEFLANTGETAAVFNSQLGELAALAEAVVLHNGPYVEITTVTEE